MRREELLQNAAEGIDKCRAEIGQLEATVGHLRILKEWQDANPEAPARIQQMMTDLERCGANPNSPPSNSSSRKISNS